MANTCKWHAFTVHTVHKWHKLAESHIMPETYCETAGCNTSRKHTWISIFENAKSKSGIPEHKKGKKNI